MNVAEEYIRRKDVAEMLENAQQISDGEYSGYCTEDVSLDSIPTANVAPVRHGKIVWKRRTVGGFKRYTGIENVGEFGETHTVTVDERNETKVPYCSECGKKLDDTFLNFCPNCGVKLDEGEENGAE